MSEFRTYTYRKIKDLLLNKKIYKPYQLIRKTQMSNTLDVGPIEIMKRAMELASQTFGAARYSGSTLSL